MSILRSLPLAAGLLLSACAYSPRVATDFDPAANFASYRTYTMLPVAVPRGMNPLMYRRLEATIDGALQARGFTRAEPGDFGVAFTLGENDRTEIDSYGGYGGYGGYYPGWGGRGWGGGWGGWGGGWGGPGWGWGGGWGGYPGLDSYTVTDRRLVIDIYDQKTRQPVWHGAVTTTGYPDQVDYRALNASIAAILVRFPPVPLQGPMVGTAPATGATN